MGKRMFTGAGIALVGVFTGAFTVLVSQRFVRTIESQTVVDEREILPEEREDVGDEFVNQASWLYMHLTRRGMHETTASRLVDEITSAYEMTENAMSPLPEGFDEFVKGQGFSDDYVGAVRRALIRSDLGLVEK